MFMMIGMFMLRMGKSLIGISRMFYMSIGLSESSGNLFYS